ncbi:TetR/AcrR family transcriptional regulator [Rugamonas sp.]|uniref:TetR/AcrR family transcriptional regulator n=1 Tax=Rugamonas sp. TaxID=1926287 RepID=UPI0025E39C0E|nr:TetR/AcrR family transcriptional regulator [Rugamonas sp.]
MPKTNHQMPNSSESPVTRGPAEHERRTQIIEAAVRSFAIHGYQKTTIADLAKAIGMSTAYIYKFFESKQAIGEVVCARTMGVTSAALLAVADDSSASACERLSTVFETLVERGYDLLDIQPKLHEIAMAAVDEGWASVRTYRAELGEVVRRIVVAGRDSHEFESSAAPAEVCQGLLATLIPFSHPVFLRQTSRQDMLQAAAAVSALVLRGLILRGLKI